jgi:hypothetical protein
MKRMKLMRTTKKNPRRPRCNEFYVVEPFSFTPAPFPWERQKQPDTRLPANKPLNATALTRLFPLPAGEGQVEGERAHCPNIVPFDLRLLSEALPPRAISHALA